MYQNVIARDWKKVGLWNQAYLGSNLDSTPNSLAIVCNFT